ncbi:MAG: hypothetical protein ACREK4_20660 [Candidatus Rokuibacteriota bacterium]
MTRRPLPQPGDDPWRDYPADIRRDGCPTCGAPRLELREVAPGRFYCNACGVAGAGPSSVVPACAMQLALDVST